MQNNMNKVLDRGTKLEDLQDKTGTILVEFKIICNGTLYQKYQYWIQYDCYVSMIFEYFYTGIEYTKS